VLNKLSTVDVAAIFFGAFVLGSRIAHICALSQMSMCSCTPTLHSTTISRFVYIFFQQTSRNRKNEGPLFPIFFHKFKVALHFFHHTIRQVIWPCPCTLAESRTLILESYQNIGRPRTGRSRSVPAGFVPTITTQS